MLINENNHRLLNMIDTYLSNRDFTISNLKGFENLNIEIVRQLFSCIYI